MEYLVANLSDVQVALDDELTRDLQHWHEIADRLPQGHPLQSLARDVQINPLRLAEVRIEVDLELNQSSEAEGSVELQLFGRPIHTFYHSRFRTSETSTCRIELTCEAVPANVGTKP